MVAAPIGCRVCCGPPGTAGGVCFACRVVGRRLGLPLAPVLPARLCPVPGPLYTVLMGYKESPVREARDRFAPLVRQLFGDFLRVHASCVVAAAGGPIDAVLPVPSSRRPSGSPLWALDGLAAVACAPLAGARWSPDLLVRGGRPANHMRPDASAFVVPGARQARVRGRRVLLLDDTYVSGARAQSAASSLRRAGAGAAVIVAAGRVLRPDRGSGHAAFLRAVGDSDGVDVAGCRRTKGLRCWRCAQTGAVTE